MKCYVVAAKRTAIGKFLGSLSSVSAVELGATVISNIISESGINPSIIDEVIVGNVLSAGLGQGVARQAAIKGGVPKEVPAYGVNMICGSGMKSIINGVASIKCGTANIILAGGVESMSNAGFILPGAVREGYKMGDLSAKDHMVYDGLTDAFEGYHMGITAEKIAEKYGITREAQDAFAAKSQQRAIAAVDGGKFINEIVPVEYKQRKETIIFDTDEFPNRASSIEKLSTLRPAFKKDGTVTAGNASGINDGASFMLIASEEAVEKYNLTPLCEIVGVGQGGVDPSIMGMGPVPAIEKALSLAEINFTDIDIIELNEAFAAQSLGVISELKAKYDVNDEWIESHTNVNGGAIALGHPIGASGNRITVSLIHEMLRSGANYGLASLCIGGGMGTAIILKKIQ